MTAGTTTAAARVDPNSGEFRQLIYSFVRDLYPICRSITGDGLRDTLRRIEEKIPLHIHEVRSGTPVFDWTVPREWNIQDAYVKNSRGDRVWRFRRTKCDLHVANERLPNAKLERATWQRAGT